MNFCTLLCILCLLFVSIAALKEKEEDALEHSWSPEEIAALLIEHKILPEPKHRASKHVYSLGKFSIEFKNVDSLWTQSPFRQMNQVYNTVMESIQKWRRTNTI
jgi:hypothetical protein